MLEHPREPLRRLDPYLLSVLVEAAHQHLLRTQNVTLQPRNAEAAFHADHLSFLAHQLRVDQGPRSVAHVIDEKPLRHPHLRRGQTDPRRRVHGLDHVRDQLPGLVRHAFH